jgi:hypothetical protein
VRASDRLVDLGAGLGRVLVLAHLLSAAHGLGVEIQAPLVHRARAHCAALGLDAIHFVHANAAEIELDGTICFLYAPCNGAMLGQVLARLAAAARRHPILVATVGVELGDVGWLRPRATAHRALALYDASL